MFIDHFATVFFPHNSLISLLYRLPGRMAAPVFCFFIAQGFYYTSNRKNYIIRLLIFAVISHLPYNMSFGYTMFQATSVIWPLALGLIALTAIKNEKIHIIFKIMILGVCCILSYRANWNFVAVLWVVVFGLFHGNLKHQIIGFSIVGILFHLVPVFYRFGFFHDRFPQWFQLGIFLTIPLLIIYNNRSGKKSVFTKWFFYVFYPGHLILLYILKNYTAISQYLEKLI